MIERPRRLRRSPVLREAVAETRLATSNLIQPHFVLADPARREPIEALPGIERQGVEALLATVEADLELGIRQVLLFGLPAHKDARGSGGASPEGPTATALRRLRQEFGDEIVLAADVCLCPYTEHGHCGVLRGEEIDNDATLPLLAEQAITFAANGADVVAPSDMMDGRVATIRHALDGAGYSGTTILSYAVKYASSYYGPFREAAHSAPAFGDRRSHQMDPRNRREALREVALDEREGADVVMVKPALAYLDVIAAVRAATALPVAAYNVSGEYSAVKLLAKAGFADERAMVLENLHAIRRAGADLILTYHARDVARGRWLA
jgi:porphobilinogen synthase